MNLNYTFEQYEKDMAEQDSDDGYDFFAPESWGEIVVESIVLNGGQNE